jgi:Sulfotransferase family
MPEAQSSGDRVRAIILTTQRTGSTFLVECLRSHPDIESSGEILNGDPDLPQPAYRGPFKDVVKAFRYASSGAWLADRWIRDFYARGSAKVRCFKAMYNQLARPFAMRFFDENPDVKVMHLRRHNLLKVHVSTLLMSKRRFVQTRRPTDAVWLRVDPARAIASMRATRSVQERFDKAFERHPRLQLAYESLFDGQFLQADSSRAICAFLGVPYSPMQSKLMKLNPEALRDMVTNYDELSAAVSKTEFADMLA